MLRRLPVLATVASSLLAVGCPKPAPPPPFAADEHCMEGLAEVFGAQGFVVLAARPVVGGSVFTPAHLAAVDRVTLRLEEARTDHTLAVRSPTTLPLMEPAPLGARMIRMRDEMPEDQPAVERFRALLYSYDFAIGDVLDPGGSAAYVQLPAGDFAGVDLDALVEELRPEVAAELMLALDGTPGADPALYREVAGGGPGADGAWVAFRAEEAGALKTPEFLRALKGYQDRTRALPAIAGAYSVVDDIRLTRRMVHKGDVGAMVLPPKQAEINQLLMLYDLSGNSEEFGARMTEDARATVIRFGFAADTPADRDALLRRIEQFAGEGFPDDVTATVCPE